MASGVVNSGGHLYSTYFECSMYSTFFDKKTVEGTKACSKKS